MKKEKLGRLFDKYFYSTIDWELYDDARISLDFVITADYNTIKSDSCRVIQFAKNFFAIRDWLESIYKSLVAKEVKTRSLLKKLSYRIEMDSIERTWRKHYKFINAFYKVYPDVSLGTAMEIAERSKGVPNPYNLKR